MIVFTLKLKGQRVISGFKICCCVKCSFFTLIFQTSVADVDKPKPTPSVVVEMTKPTEATRSVGRDTFNLQLDGEGGSVEAQLRRSLDALKMNSLTRKQVVNNTARSPDDTTSNSGMNQVCFISMFYFFKGFFFFDGF